MGEGFFSSQKTSKFPPYAPASELSPQSPGKELTIALTEQPVLYISFYSGIDIT